MNPQWKNHLLPEIHTFKDKTIVLRVDWNMPVVNGKITDTSRFDVTLPFLQTLSFTGIKFIILTHFGEEGESLKPIADYITHLVPFITFNPSLDFNELEQASRNLQPGNGLLLENVRMWRGETENIPSLARSFASLGNVFINDAFSVAHRDHASVAGIAKLMLSYFGPTFTRELEHLTRAQHPEKPALLILGGAKISTKLPVIEHYLNQGVHVFIGGAMVHNIWKQRGLEIGKSLYDENYTVSEDLLSHPLLLTPIDVVLATGNTVKITDIPQDGIVVDCGNETVAMVEKLILESKTVIANGPLGLYEKGWLHGSEQILTKLAESSAVSYIGGGDTVTVAHSLHLLRKFTFVSLGGGGMLTYLASGTMPGIDAVTK